MFESLTALPPLDPTAINQAPLVDPGKRQWETGQSGYFNWAVGQLLDKSAAPAGGSIHSTIGALASTVEDVGQTEALTAAVEATKTVSADLYAVDASPMAVPRP